MRFKLPGLLVLEIGGGTASLSAPLVEALLNNDEGRCISENFGEYVFTDISPGFFAAAREKLDKYSQHVQFMKFDMDLPPEDQGFDLGSFDLIVASNVIHVCESLNTTLGHLRRLLKPTGNLAFVEVTNPSLR